MKKASRSSVIAIAALFLLPLSASANLYSPNGGVVVVHANGTYTDYTAASNSNAARGTAFSSAISALSNGDAVYLSAGTFTTNISTFIDLSIDGSKSVNLHGAGESATVIDTPINVGTNSQITDLTLTQNHGNTWYPVGASNAISSATSFWVKNVAVNGNIDGFGIVSTNSNLTINVIGSAIHSNFDTFVVPADGSCHSHVCTVNIYDTNFSSSYDPANFTTGMTGLAVDGVTANIWNTNFHMDESASPQDPADALGIHAYANAVVNFYSGTITTIGSVNIGDSNIFDIENPSGGTVNVTSQSNYDHAKVSGPVNTISFVPESVPSLPAEPWKMIIPVLNAPAMLSISSAGASVSSSVSDNKIASSTQRGFRYSTDGVSWSSTTPETGTFGTETFTANLSGLSCGTQYQVQSFALNPAGYGYSQSATFNTVACPQSSTPSVSSNSSGTSIALVQSPDGSYLPALPNASPAAPTSPTVPGCPIGYTCAPKAPFAANAAYPFARNLTMYSSGEDARQLQIYLNGHGSVIASTGKGSPGNESSIFGLRTKNALISFQKAHGIPPTGFFGAITRAYIQAHP